MAMAVAHASTAASKLAVSVGVAPQHSSRAQRVRFVAPVSVSSELQLSKVGNLCLPWWWNLSGFV